MRVLGELRAAYLHYLLWEKVPESLKVCSTFRQNSQWESHKKTICTIVHGGRVSVHAGEGITLMNPTEYIVVVGQLEAHPIK